MTQTQAWRVAAAADGETPLELAAIAAAVGEDSEVLAAVRERAKRPDNPLGLLLRDLTREEVAILESKGCRADDWTLVRVAEDFDPFRVRRTHFIGCCALGRFSGEAEVAPGITLPTGVYGCTLIESQVGNDCLVEQVSFCAHCVVEHGCVLFDVGSITCSPGVTYGIGREVSLGCETGGREVPLWPELRPDEAGAIAAGRDDADGLEAVRTAVAAYADEARGDVCWIRRGAVIRHSKRIRDSYIGSGVLIDQVSDLDGCTVLGNLDEPTEISAGAAVSGSLMQPGSKVSGGAIVRESLLCEHAHVDENAVVEASLIGPNSAIAKGEVTASLVGPFVALHHQSLLIAAFWPEGKGNISYGAMVGSNHTGRAPDQEIWAGEGVFYGLGCSIKFPADYSQAPYSVIGSGVDTLAQKVRYPFSLITTPAEPIGDDAAVPRAYNELMPAWGLWANAYAIVRMELKFADRDRARRTRIPYQVLRPRIMRLVHDALGLLRAVDPVREVYTERDLPGVGKNFLREAIRLRAVDAYDAILRRYCLRVLLAEAEGHAQIGGSEALAHELADELMPGTAFEERMRSLVAIERANAEVVQKSKEADDQRGRRIIPGYELAHPPAAEDPVVADAWERVRSTEDRVARLLKG